LKKNVSWGCILR